MRFGVFFDDVIAKPVYLDFQPHPNLLYICLPRGPELEHPQPPPDYGTIQISEAPTSGLVT